MRPFALLVPLVFLGIHPAPKSGEDLVRQMHDRYAGKWYHNLTFTQTTSFPDRPAETWYEAGEIPGKLRIDIAPLDSMNAFMYLGDSSIVFKAGKRVGAREDRNLLMTLGFDVYGQPPQTTVAQIKAAHVDLTKIREDSWRGAKVWVVGAEKGDTTTNQFWIEQDRLLFVRLIEEHKTEEARGETRHPRHHLRGLSAAGQGVGRADLRDQGGREGAAAGEVPEHPGRREAATGFIRSGDVSQTHVDQDGLDPG